MATSPRPYKNQETKALTSQDQFIKPKEMVRVKKIEGARKERMKRWITFFRRNPHRFITEYFGIKLHPFQVLMIYVLQKSNLAYIVASRAASKTWIIAVWALTLAVLYPGIKIIVCSKTLKQGGILLSEKLNSFISSYPNVAREIKSITTNANTYEAIFHCGSSIRVVPSSESARGNRANYIIIEESRLVPKEVLESIIKPFLEVRNPPYKDKPEYAFDPRLKEEGTISYITSAWYTAEYWYTYVKSCIRRMVAGDETANFLAFDYLITLYHNIKTEAMIKNEMEDADAVTVQMEYLNIPSGSSGKSYFKPTLFNRNLKQAFYPQRDDEYNEKKNVHGLKKIDGEIRLLSVDVATRANKVNDNSIISCIRMIPLMGKGYERHLVYMESHKGQHVGVQAQRIKEIFYDFEADFISLDLQNAGIAVFDSLSEPTLCEERGITYPPMTVVDEAYDIIKQEVRDDLRLNHTRGLNALPVIFPISASQNLNSQIATSFRSSLQKKLWRFLIPDGDAEEYLVKSVKEFTSKSTDSELTAFYLMPYIQTGLMVGECINLDMTLVSGFIKLTEKPGCYKDRYSSISYGNFVISSQFDKNLLTENEETDEFYEILSLVQTT
jgi:hypothetical protein